MLSIIIPTLNEDKILDRTLAAIKKLKSVNFELIISDGGSTDKTLEVARKHADVVLTHQGPARQTIGQGRNAGAAAAKGEFLLFLDADVFIPDINEFMPIALSAFREHSSLVGLTVFLKVLPEHVTLADSMFFWLVNHIHQIANNFLHTGTASGEFMLVKASAFNTVGGFSQTLVMGEDNDLFKRLSRVGRTRIESGLYVMHTSRRAHHTGHLRLLGLWFLNNLWTKLTKKSWSKEWKVIR